jgi:hypothetical protein
VKRERFYECVLVSDRDEYRFHFRAWDAEEAEQRLMDDLREHGLTVAGELRVLDLKGKVIRRGQYVPGPVGAGLREWSEGTDRAPSDRRGSAFDG